MTNDQKTQLQSQLWNIANTLRGKMGADEFRDYILGFIFYKYLSERMQRFAVEILQHDGIRFTDIDDATEEGKELLAAVAEESSERLGYFLKPSETFHAIAAKGAGRDMRMNSHLQGSDAVGSNSFEQPDNFILEDLANTFKHIEESTLGHASEEDFEGLFEELDLGSSKLGKTETQKNALIAKVLEHLDGIDFRLDDAEADVLGDAYEYLIGQFASGAGKKAGEFYTPQAVSSILARLVTTGKTSLRGVYDPTCGSGSLLLRVAREVDQVGGYYGQEMNPTTYNLARMNMILHGVHYRRFDLRNDDTLEHPAPEHQDLQFEAIVANPPFSANWSASERFEHDERFADYGKLAPKTKADFAFVQHMAHHLADDGAMAVLVPHGVLFRGAAEGHIRRYLIETKNWLDAVIGLPANIFYGTGIPTCILVLKKQRQHPDNVLFIDASAQFEKVGNQNQLRDADLDRIVDTFRRREASDKYSHVAPLSEIADNDYNLNIPRYVDTFEEEEPVDLAAVSAELKKLDAEMAENDAVIAGFCAELGIPTPDGHNASLLRLYKKGLMQQLFSQQLRFRDDDGRAFPDWGCDLVKNILKSVPTKQHQILATDISESGSYPVVDQGKKPIAGYSDRKECVYAQTPVIVFGDHTTEIKFVDHPFVVGADGTKLLTSNSENYDLRYLYYALHRFNVEQEGYKRHFSILKSVRLPLPGIEEQTKIANFLSAVDAKIDAVSQQIAQTQTFKQGLLQQMFV